MTIHGMKTWVRHFALAISKVLYCSVQIIFNLLALLSNHYAQQTCVWFIYAPAWIISFLLPGFRRWISRCIQNIIQPITYTKHAFKSFPIVSFRTIHLYSGEHEELYLWTCKIPYLLGTPELRWKSLCISKCRGRHFVHLEMPPSCSWWVLPPSE